MARVRVVSYQAWGEEVEDGKSLLEGRSIDGSYCCRAHDCGHRSMAEYKKFEHSSAC